MIQVVGRRGSLSLPQVTSNFWWGESLGKTQVVVGWPQERSSVARARKKDGELERQRVLATDTPRNHVKYALGDLELTRN